MVKVKLKDLHVSYRLVKKLEKVKECSFLLGDMQNTNEYDIQSLILDFYAYALLFQIKYVLIFIVKK